MARKNRSRFQILSALLAAASLFLLIVGCTSTSASQNAGSINCRATEDINSYEYLIEVKFNSPAFSTAEGATSFGTFSQEIDTFFERVEMIGSVAGPTAGSLITRSADAETEVRTISGRSWLRNGNIWREVNIASVPSVNISPMAVCGSVAADLASTLLEGASKTEDIGGIESRRYSLRAGDGQELARLLSSTGGNSLRNISGTVWLARSGRWPVRLELSSSGTNSGGQPVSLDMIIEFRNVNRPLSILPPQP